MTLVPSPPSSKETKPSVMIQNLRDVSPNMYRGGGCYAAPSALTVVVIPAHLLHLNPTDARNISREEVAARKECKEVEQKERKDVEFEISVFLADWRAKKRTAVRYSIAGEKNDDEKNKKKTGDLEGDDEGKGQGRISMYVRKVDVGALHLHDELHLMATPDSLLVSTSVQRRRTCGGGNDGGNSSPSTNNSNMYSRFVLHHKKPKSSLQTQKVENEEVELRHWVIRLEMKLREGMYDGQYSEFFVLTAIPRTQSDEHNERQTLLEEEKYDWWQLSRLARLQRPPFNRCPFKEELPFSEEQEEKERGVIVEEEVDDRRQCFEYLFLRYGVRLFSVQRVEDGFRMDLEEEFYRSLCHQVQKFFAKSFKQPLLAMTGLICALPDSPARMRLSQLAGVNVAVVVKEKSKPDFDAAALNIQNAQRQEQAKDEIHRLKNESDKKKAETEESKSDEENEKEKKEEKEEEEEKDESKEEKTAEDNIDDQQEKNDVNDSTVGEADTTGDQKDGDVVPDLKNTTDTTKKESEKREEDATGVETSERSEEKLKMKTKPDPSEEEKKLEDGPSHEAQQPQTAAPATQPEQTKPPDHHQEKPVSVPSQHRPPQHQPPARKVSAGKKWWQK